MYDKCSFAACVEETEDSGRVTGSESMIRVRKKTGYGSICTKEVGNNCRRKRGAGGNAT